MFKSSVVAFEQLHGGKNLEVRRFVNFMLHGGTTPPKKRMRKAYQDEQSQDDQSDGSSKEHDDIIVSEGGGGGAKDDRVDHVDDDDTHAKLMQVSHGWLGAPYLKPARQRLAGLLGQARAPNAPYEGSNQAVLKFELSGSGMDPVTWSYDKRTATWKDAHVEAFAVYARPETYDIQLWLNHDPDQMKAPTNDLIGVVDGALAVVRQSCPDFAQLRQEVQANPHMLMDAVNDVVSSYDDDKPSMQDIKCLLRAKVNVNEIDSDGNTALYFASSYGDDDLVQVLIDAKANVHATNEDIDTPLHHNCEHAGFVPVITALVSAKADVNAKNAQGYTPLMQASMHGRSANEDVVRALLNAKADATIKRHGTGNTALDFARVFQHRMNPRIIDMLQRASSSKSP